MDHTAIQPGLPHAKSAEMGVHAGPPNGTLASAPKQRIKSPLVRVLETIASLRITVTLFLLASILIFWGTLAQVDNGVWTVVNQYFRSYILLVPLKVVMFNLVDNTDIVIPFPGGWLIGWTMLANLLAAHAVRFKLAWNRAGILLIHAGLIIIMVGEFVTGTFQVEGNMIIQTGQTVNYVIHAGQTELAIINTLGPKEDEVISVPASRLTNANVVDDEKLPFKVEVVRYMVNSDLLKSDRDKNDPDMKGFGRFHVAKELAEVSGVDTNQRHDAPSAYVKLSDRKGNKLGTWLLSTLFEQPQWIKIDAKEYQVALRYKQRPREFSFHLKKFEHKVFPGTNKPRDFHSYIHLSDPSAGIEWDDVEIYMNAPLRYKGETFYQSSWTTDPMTRVANGTVLQVVRNPGWLLPYISCVVVGVGMLLHFGLTLTRFINRRSVR